MTQFQFRTTAEEAANALSEHIKGKTVLITGVTIGGIGFETARVIAHHSPKLLILAGRSEENVDNAIKAIQKEVPGASLQKHILDLDSFAKVRESAKEVEKWDESVVIDVLINNAGLLIGEKKKMSVDGIEYMFALNHLGHFLFTNLIMDRILRAGKGARIINLTCGGHFRSDIRYDDWNWEDGSYESLPAFGQSKTGNILFSVYLADKLKPKGILSYAVHPGGVWTNMSRDSDISVTQKLGFMDENGKLIDTPIMTWKNIHEAASTPIVAAFDPSITERSGAYMSDCNIDDPGVYAFAVDKDNAKKLWALSEKLVGQEFPLQDESRL